MPIEGVIVIMKYSDLVHFEPIESVIQLEQADSPAAVRQLVQTFVVSKRMSEQLCDLVIPNLQFESRRRQQGCPHRRQLRHGQEPLAVADFRSGRVYRDGHGRQGQGCGEGGEGDLRKVQSRAAGTPGHEEEPAQHYLRQARRLHGRRRLPFSFPADDQVDSNKDDLSSMMAQFSEKYPNHGLLLVVDELLDYLRSRKQHDLILDLGFLREMGEVCKLDPIPRALLDYRRACSTTPSSSSWPRAYAG